MRYPHVMVQWTLKDLPPSLLGGRLSSSEQSDQGGHMQARPVQADYFRWGGLAAMVAGGLGIVMNLLHPRSTENVGNARAHLEMIAGSDIWKFDHAGIAVAIMIGLVGVIAIGLSMAATAGDAWARTWLLFTAASSAVLVVVVAIDGNAIKAAADRWAGSGNDAAAFAAAAGIEGLASALFTVGVLMYFGISPLLLGKAVLTSGSYPKALGQVSLVAGALGCLAALLIWIQGLTMFNSVILFPISSVLGTAVLIWAGWELWKSNGTLGTSGTTDTTKIETPVTPGL